MIGFIVAPLIGALPLLLLNPPNSVAGLLIILALAYAHALIASLPLFLWLRHRRVAPTFITCAIAGGASIVLVWMLTGLYSGAVVLLAMIIACPLGALGGASFWLIACRGVPDIPLVWADVAERTEEG